MIFIMPESEAVITGLDPVIHAFFDAAEGASDAWMAGSSPAMTVRAG
jgi:hypothetical protein